MSLKSPRLTLFYANTLFRHFWCGSHKLSASEGCKRQSQARSRNLRVALKDHFDTEKLPFKRVSPFLWFDWNYLAAPGLSSDWKHFLIKLKIFLQKVENISLKSFKDFLKSYWTDSFDLNPSEFFIRLELSHCTWLQSILSISLSGDKISSNSWKDFLKQWKDFFKTLTRFL